MPSPTNNDSADSRDERDAIPSSESQSPGAGPPVRRPSVEQLDPAEVREALKVADLLARAKPAGTIASKKAKSEEVKKPSPPPPAEFIPRPPPVPFSDNSNPDAAALRAATSLLQMQKAKGAHDIQTLEQLRELNRKDPLEFMKQLKAGKLKSIPGHGIIGPTLGPDIEKLVGSIDLEAPDGKKSEEATPEAEDAPESATTDEKGREFPPFPVPQNIIRTPAINWAKYGIVGDTLDKMHEEQKTNPSLGQPEKLATRDSQPAIPIAEQHQYLDDKASKFVIAAPYDPLRDDVKRGLKKPY